MAGSGLLQWWSFCSRTKLNLAVGQPTVGAVVPFLNFSPPNWWADVQAKNTFGDVGDDTDNHSHPSSTAMAARDAILVQIVKTLFCYRYLLSHKETLFFQMEIMQKHRNFKSFPAAFRLSACIIKRWGETIPVHEVPNLVPPTKVTHEMTRRITPMNLIYTFTS